MGTIPVTRRTSEGESYSEEVCVARQFFDDRYGKAGSQPGIPTVTINFVGRSNDRANE